MDLVRVQTQNEELNRIQNNIQQSISGIKGSTPFIGGSLLTGVSVKMGQDNAIPHGLTRTPTVWVICDQNTGTNVWRTSWDSNFLTLQCSADCTVSLWVY